MIGLAVGRIVATRAGLLEAVMPAVCVGVGAQIVRRDGSRVPARVVAIDGRRAFLAPLGSFDGIAAGDRIEEDAGALHLCLGTAALGRGHDGLGAPLDGRGYLAGKRARGDRPAGVSARRARIDRVFFTGVRAIDGPLALGVGARIGLFGAPGCGKSTLLEAIVAGSAADVTVVALIGERGREAQRWLAAINDRTIVVCATSDRTAAERLRAAEVAMAQAEALRRRGLRVLLVLDSLARVAGAARDVAVAAGESVGRGGYPASVFAYLACLLEQAGHFTVGSITLVATVLSEGADEHDPVSEACRAALDGHIVLSERLARQGWFPAIDLPASVSRTLTDIASTRHHAAAQTLRAAVAILEQTREARGFGLDPSAGDPSLRRALAAEGAITAFLCQAEQTDPRHTLTKLFALADILN